MASYRILQIHETTRNNELRQIIPVRVVRYMVGTHGPFVYETDAKDFSADRVAPILEAAAQEVIKLQGS